MPATSNVCKFIRDPIHDIIRIQQRDEFILRLLDTAPMQRLRRIRQLGVAWLVYPGAEHSRFTHSLGVFHLAGRVMSQLEDESGRQPGHKLFDEERRQAVLAAALLHDVGHGPFSHIFERIGASGIPGHEEWTVKIVRESQDVQQALASSMSTDLPELVCQIIDHTHRPYYASAIISSQLDVDRFDYLLRDSYMTGTHYGAFDLEWMLRTLAVREVHSSPAEEGNSAGSLETIVVDVRRGRSALEAHLLGRHYMYRHVYYHKTIRSAEAMLLAILKRAAELIRDGTYDELGNGVFSKMARGEPLDVTEYLSLDDFTVLAWVEEWARSMPDKVLGDLCARLVNRRLLKAVVAEPTWSGRTYFDNRIHLHDLVAKNGYDPQYYMLEDEVADLAYKGYLYNLERGKPADEEEIWFVDGDNVPIRLSSQSNVLTEAASALQFREDRWFVPEEVARQAKTELKRS